MPIILRVKEYIPDVKLFVVGEDALDVDIHKFKQAILDNDLSYTVK